MDTYILTHRRNEVLLRDLATLVAKDRATTALLLAHVAEVDARKLYLRRACSSMHVYCMRELHLSEHEAYLRIHAADRLPALLESGLAWLGTYAVPAGGAPWSTSSAALLEPDLKRQPAPAWAPQTLPPGTHGLPAGVIMRSQRTRLIQATAEVMLTKGFAAAKVSDIVAAARVARPVFYEHFADKEEAFLEAQEHPTQFILDHCYWIFAFFDQ